ncbi:hypothetical protein SLA2020_287840 [Shorea laevis]
MAPNRSPERVAASDHFRSTQWVYMGDCSERQGQHQDQRQWIGKRAKALVATRMQRTRAIATFMGGGGDKDTEDLSFSFLILYTEQALLENNTLKINLHYVRRPLKGHICVF